MTAAETAGMKPARNWNNATTLMGSLPSLIRTNGTTSGASMAWNSPGGIWSVGYPDVPGNQRMMNGHLDPTDATAPATVTVGNLPAAFTSAGYDVYVYFVGNVPAGQSRTYRYTVGPTTFTVTQNGPTTNSAFPGFVVATDGGSAGNYTVFRNLTAASFTLTATPSSTSFQARAPVNGIQIVAPAGS